MNVLVISDTHDLIRGELIPLIREADHVIHAGDVGSFETFKKMLGLNERLSVVRGNVDRGFGPVLPRDLEVRLGGLSIYVIHERGGMKLDPSGRHDLVVFGHTHKPLFSEKDGVGYLNPGSAGPRRFHLPVGYATLNIRPDGTYRIRLEELAGE